MSLCDWCAGDKCYYIDFEQVVLECRVPSLASVRGLPYHMRIVTPKPSCIARCGIHNCSHNCSILECGAGSNIRGWGGGCNMIGWGVSGFGGCGKACPGCAFHIDTTHRTVTGGETTMMKQTKSATHSGLLFGLFPLFSSLPGRGARVGACGE